MLTAGGIDNQPAGRWLARHEAGYLWQQLEKLNDPKVDYARLTPAERALKRKIKAVPVEREPVIIELDG